VNPKMKKETFITNLQSYGRILIPYHIRRELGLKRGDKIRVTIERMEDEKDESDVC